MTRVDANAGGGGPSPMATEPASRGIQRGGFTPAAQKILESLPEEHRGVLAKELEQKEQFVKSQQQRFQTDIQKAGVLDEWLKDPQFQRFVKSREAGDLPTFFRDELRLTSPSRNDATAADQDAMPGDSAGETELNGSGNANAVNGVVDERLQQRLDELESRVQTHDQRESQAKADAFAKSHPDYEKYLPAMQLARNRLGSQAELEDLYQIAVAESRSGDADATRAGESDAAASPQTTTAASPANSTEQPPPAVSARTSAPSEKKQARSVEEAWEQSKEDLGIKGPLTFQFE